MALVVQSRLIPGAAGRNKTYSIIGGQNPGRVTRRCCVEGLESEEVMDEDDQDEHEVED
jgi:hypothetical protein